MKLEKCARASAQIAPRSGDGKVRRLGGKQEFEFNVRVIAATNQGTAERNPGRKLREDLYYRLTVFTVHLPRFRDRRRYTAPGKHFIGEFNRSTARVRSAARTTPWKCS